MGLFEHFPYTNFQDLNLDSLLKSMKYLIEEMYKLENLVGGYNARIKELENFVAALERGNFPPAFINTLYKWLNKNVPEILSKVITQVWFGLTDSGYFVAYIPESWQDIVFNTTEYDIHTYLQPEYGHLVLSSKGGY